MADPRKQKLEDSIGILRWKLPEFMVPNRTKIDSIERVMIHKASGRVSDAVLGGFGGFLGDRR